MVCYAYFQTSGARPELAVLTADPDADTLLRDVMSQNDLDGEPADLPDEIKRKIVEVLVENGVISFGDDDAA